MAYGLSIRDKRRSPIKKTFIGFTTVSLATLFFAPDFVSNRVVQGRQTLSGAEITELFAGKTVSGRHLRRGYSFTSYYEPGGTYRSYQNGASTPREANWYVTGDEICITWMNPYEGPLCRHMVRERDGSYTKVLKKHRKWIDIGDFHSFQAGNPQNL